MYLWFGGLSKPVNTKDGLLADIVTTKLELQWAHSNLVRGVGATRGI